MEPERSIRIPLSASLVAVGVLLVGAGLVVGYATGLLRTLGHESWSTSGSTLSMNKAGSSWGFSTIPLAPGQQIVVDYDVKIANGELWISFHNYGSPPVAAIAGGQHDFRSLKQSGKGRLAFRAEHWGFFRLDATPVCGLRRDCSVDYDLNWGLP